MRTLVSLLVWAAAPEGTWSLVSTADGVTLEARAVKDSSFFEYRATAETEVTVEALCAEIFDWGSLSQDHDNLKSRKLLADLGEARVVYDQIEPPVVSNRDFAFTVRRTHSVDGGCSIDFVSSPELAPPVPAGWVRMKAVSGGWRFSRQGGSTRVVYTLFTDPGGALPALVVHGSQREVTVKTLQKGIHRARARSTVLQAVKPPP